MNVIASIRATSAGLPTSGDLVSGTIDISTISSTPTWYEFTFGAGTTLTAGVKYAIVLRYPSGTGGDLISWRYVNPSAYAGGVAVDSVDSGSTWGITSGGNYDFLFEDWGDPLPAIAHNFAYIIS